MGLRINRFLSRRPAISLALFVGVPLLASGFSLSTIWVWGQVVLALSLVIFVHELGHFAVAKWCGVQCDKFYIGFDPWGLKLFSKKWGETEYGIGLLPLGGYVKMLGQEDNPSKIQEEIERAKASGGEYKLDPRSYLAKSVPQRMAIISAGVIMNVIFAWVVASIAYGIGVDYTPGQIGGVSAGGTAWQVGMEPGDTVKSIAGKENPSFKDLRIAATFKDGEGVPLIVVRDGRELTFKLQPSESSDGRGILGVEPTYTLQLGEKLFVRPGTPAAEATPAFAANDTIVAAIVGGEEIKLHLNDYQAWNQLLVAHQDETIEFVVQRKDAKTNETTETRISVRPNKMRSLGLVMTMGKIVAVRKGSVAEAAGIQAGDILRSVTPVAADPSATDNTAAETVLDPMRLPDRLRNWAYKNLAVNIKLERDGQQMELNDVQLTQPKWVELPLDDNSAMSAPALGIAYSVTNRIQQILPDSPAARAKNAALVPGAEVVAVEFAQPAYDDEEARTDTLSLKDENSWPAVVGYLLQRALPETKVKLSVIPPNAGKDAEPTDVELMAEPDRDITVADRGFYLVPLNATRTADSVGEAMKLGLYETGESLTLIYKFLARIPQLWKGMGGPISIVRIAGDSAERGMSELLIFIAMLSANLAVINFLPIPVLDGGHFVFLTLEGIRGKPVSEKVFLMFSYLGLAFLLGIMVFTISLDISRLGS